LSCDFFGSLTTFLSDDDSLSRSFSIMALWSEWFMDLMGRSSVGRRLQEEAVFKASALLSRRIADTCSVLDCLSKLQAGSGAASSSDMPFVHWPISERYLANAASSSFEDVQALRIKCDAFSQLESLALVPNRAMRPLSAAASAMREQEVWLGGEK
jgi:hypothetical protein